MTDLCRCDRHLACTDTIEPVEMLFRAFLQFDRTAAELAGAAVPEGSTAQRHASLGAARHGAARGRGDRPGGSVEGVDASVDTLKDAALGVDATDVDVDVEAFGELAPVADGRYCQTSNEKWPVPPASLAISRTVPPSAAVHVSVVLKYRHDLRQI